MKRASEPRTGLSFPRISRIILERFSLYNQKPKIEVAVPAGVLCLAGANGIGKSTFLAAVNFGLTGIVPVGSKAFLSASEYYQDGLRFTREYFEGRIDEDDREAAQISITFGIGASTFSITRGIFEQRSLRALSIETDGRIGRTFDESTPEQRHTSYSTAVAGSAGVKTFEQFAFLQHLVLTFDESRRLLFWDARAVEQALHLAFGQDPNAAAEAEKLRRKMEKAGSRGRNLQYQATNVFNRIRIIEEALGLRTPGASSDAEDLVASHKALSDERDNASDQLERAEAKVSDAEVALAQASAGLLSLRADYEAAFARMIGRTSLVGSHPIVRSLLEEERCVLCGATGISIAKQVRKTIDGGECPLCSSHLLKSERPTAAAVSLLKSIDAKLAKAKETLEALDKSHRRLAEERDRAREHFVLAQESLGAFEAKHEAAAALARERVGPKSKSAAQTLGELRAEQKALLSLKEEAYAARDDCKRKLRTLEKKLELSFVAAEQRFVPLFRELAGSFLGLELDIRMERREATGLGLLLELRNTTRREEHQLSESQRFFIDIALRMSIAQFMSLEASPAGLLIDTPEGSLDIAYESRAGEMFAKFVKGGHSIMMTANINSSQLLLKLARECGKKRMSLTRMTTWTDLSQVQMDENKLFSVAYADIEKELGSQSGKS